MATTTACEDIGIPEKQRMRSGPGGADERVRLQAVLPEVDGLDPRRDVVSGTSQVASVSIPPVVSVVVSVSWGAESVASVGESESVDSGGSVVDSVDAGSVVAGSVAAALSDSVSCSSGSSLQALVHIASEIAMNVVRG